MSSANATSWSTTLPTVPGPTYSTCVGSSYRIRSSDTCQSIATSQNVSTVALMMANNLQSKCMNFPTSGSLCIPASGKCSIYTVKTNDTCAIVANQVGVAWAQIVSWNPIVGVGCAMLPAYVGFQICISNPGGTWVNPYTTSLSTAAITTYQ
jgi:LysM repeat protein